MLRALSLLLVLAACRSSPAPEEATGGPAATVASAVLPARPSASASSSFWEAWGDGRAELNHYDAVMERYGAPREAEIVLIYVTEPVSRRTLVKDDDAQGRDRLDVLKLNVSERFLTGIYPYSVMTSVFSPVDDWGGARFQPVKLTLTAQEWCGHVFRGVWPRADSFRTTLFSYFADEGEATATVAAPAGTLYEDALLIQLRELDGLFNTGGDWRGPLVPSLWRQRKSHRPLEPAEATITRAGTTRDGVAVTRFTLTQGDYTRTFDVETAASRRVLAWETSDGDRAVLVQSERLPYWQLNTPADTTYRAQLGLDARP